MNLNVTTFYELFTSFFTNSQSWNNSKFDFFSTNNNGVLFVYLMLLFPTNQFVKIQNFGIGNSWNHEVNYTFFMKMIHCAAYYCSKVESRDYSHSCEEKLEKSCQITTWDVIPAKITKWMIFVIWNSWNHGVNHTFLEKQHSSMYCFKVEFYRKNLKNPVKSLKVS